MKRKIYYYHDPKNDDFAATNIRKISLPDDYKYIDRNLFYRLGETAVRAIALPLVWLILKVVYLQRIRSRKVLKEARGQSFFLYGNHTDYMLDAYTPGVIAFPQRAHILVNPDAVSIRGLGTVVKMLGAVPVPASVTGVRNYLRGIRELIDLKRVIMVYPEAHIWPYYTDIRPFGAESFYYPAEAGAPCFAVTNIYRKRSFGFIKRPKVVTYIDGPFRPDMDLRKKERAVKLRNEVYAAMKARVNENPRYDYCDYIYVEDGSLVTKTKKR